MREMEVLYRDEHLLVVNKPSGMLVHRGWGRDSVVAMTVARDLVGRHVHPVHRLDRGTSGVLAFVLDRRLIRPLQGAFTDGSVDKRYIALVRGTAPDEVVVDHPIPASEGKARVDAITEVRRLARFERYSLVRARPQTGRLHQVRRHLKHLSHHVIGDVRYGKGYDNRLFRERFGLHRLALHAVRLTLPHPVTGKRLTLEAAVPEDLMHTLQDTGMADALPA